MTNSLTHDQQKSSPNIPLYGLYGESLVSTDPGLVHVEDISERSSDLDWVIKAHRHSQLLQILCIFEGGAELKLSRETHTLAPRSIVIIPADVVHGFRFEPEVKGFVLTVDNSVIDTESSTSYQYISKLRRAQIVAAGNANSDPNYRRFLHYVDLIKEESQQHKADQNDAASALAKLAVVGLYRMVAARQMSSIGGEEESDTLARFKQLLEEHHREHWSVARYAEELHVSTSTLSRLCHHFSGESPKTIIQQRLVAEARRRLMYTRQPIEGIALLLGFKDQAYFSRFFKKLQGQSPAAYRKVSYR